MSANISVVVMPGKSRAVAQEIEEENTEQAQSMISSPINFKRPDVTLDNAGESEYMSSPKVRDSLSTDLVAALRNSGNASLKDFVLNGSSAMPQHKKEEDKTKKRKFKEILLQDMKKPISAMEQQRGATAEVILRKRIRGVEEPNLRPWSTTSLHPADKQPEKQRPLSSSRKSDIAHVLGEPQETEVPISPGRQTRQEKRQAPAKQTVSLRKSDIVLFDFMEALRVPQAPGPVNPQLKARMIAMRQKVNDKAQERQNYQTFQAVSPRDIVFDPSAVTSDTRKQQRVTASLSSSPRGHDEEAEENVPAEEVVKTFTKPP